MLIAEDVLLLLTDDHTGRAAVDSQKLTVVLAGAVLLDLVLAGRVAVTDSGRWGSGPRVAVVDPSPTDDPLLDAALARVAVKGGPVGAQALLSGLGKGLADALRDRLVQRGILRAAEGRVLGIFPTRSWPAADSSHEARVHRALWDVVVGGRTPTDREACLVSLLHAVGTVPAVLSTAGMSARELRARAKTIAAGNVGGDAVKRAIDAANAAVMAGVTAAMAASTAASS